MKFNFLFVLGTRPEVIKCAPPILELKKKHEVVVFHTGQHREMAHEMYAHFALKPDVDINLMKPQQKLYDLTSQMTAALGSFLEHHHFNMVFVQGDTTSAFVGALTAFYHKMPVAHIEAGLRTDNIYSPFPEEINRRLVSSIASLHFAPTNLARENLLKEKVDSASVFVTGNTVVDALKWTVANNPLPSNEIASLINGDDKFILVTTHRRENLGGPHKAVFEALIELTDKFEDIKILFPIHPNPAVRKQASDILGNRTSVILTPPLNYNSFVWAMSNCFFIMSDSGGIQEEAPTFKKPVLVLRDTTERPEGLKFGVLKLVGTQTRAIVDAATELLISPKHYQAMQANENPYGDGCAAQRIVQQVEQFCSAL